MLRRLLVECLVLAALTSGFLVLAATAGLPGRPDRAPVEAAGP